MKLTINMAWFTVLEVVQGRVFQILLISTLVAPLFGVLLASLFMIDIGKVYMDGVMAVVHFLSMVFVLFIVASLMSRDLEQKVCYLFVVKPANRVTYFWGRFFGFLSAYAILVLALFVISGFVGELFLSGKPELYLAGFSVSNLFSLIFLTSFQYISLLGLVFFIVSWATGFAEIILFSSVALLFSWVFPPILAVIGGGPTLGDSSSLLYEFLNIIYHVLPHLNGGNLLLNLTHQQTGISLSDFMIYCLEHIGYAGVLLISGIWFFKRRDL